MTAMGTRPDRFRRRSRATAITAREEARRSDGRFGEQHFERSSAVDLDDLTWMVGFDDDDLARVDPAPVVDPEPVPVVDPGPTPPPPDVPAPDEPWQPAPRAPEQQRLLEELVADADDLRTVHERVGRVTVACVGSLSETGEDPSQEQVAELLERHRVPRAVLSDLWPHNVPVLDGDRLEVRATAYGRRVDRWLDTELAELTAAHERHRELAARINAGAQGQERRDSGRELARLNARFPDGIRETYYRRKRELLAEIRPMGGTLEWTTGGVSTPKRVDAAIQRAASMLPADWIARSNATGEVGHGRRLYPVRVRESTTRNHYVEHRAISKKEVLLDMAVREIDTDPESYSIELESDPRVAVVAQDKLPEKYVGVMQEQNLVVVQKFEVAFPGGRDWSSGRQIVRDDGQLALSGRAAAGWEQHEYVDSTGEKRRCWRRPRKRTHTSRSYGMAELTIPKGSTDSPTALHELTHRCEDSVPEIGRREAAFKRRRTTNADGTRQPTEAYHPRLTRERVRPDNFLDRYIGKDYGRDDRFHEVMSVGNEIALYGQLGGFGKLKEGRAPLLGRRSVEDDDHHAFVLGTLLTV
ncbi:hypothetical protein [Brachybacterium paraconglomeratum]|uniref:hypothetical protein n=1 Tax=Brachybacterium paraconglomeratum TaxID=173362 RepID=UPI0022B02C71|nr:hypothetical protein [Brachybacterium paraconglomeratum]MCZ4326732.1 hypothetical protein [Brachybacterium paraconglomeratum]